MKVSVIIPAAGSGKRFGSEQNKIFQRIKGQPIFIRTLELFSGRDDVVQIQLVASSQDLGEIRERFGGNLGFMGVTLSEGGPHRSDSVRNALAKVVADADLVCVHDAVRPCVSSLWLDAVFSEAAKSGAAILAYPVHGTLKKVSNGRTIDETVDRADLWEAQTPQVFRRDVIMKAYSANSLATDDAAMAEAIGQPVSVVMGDPRNIKITTPGDLALAEAVIGSLPKPKPRAGGNPFEEARW